LIDGDPGVLELLPGGDDHLVLRAHLPHWRELLHVVRRARRIANLDADVRGPVGLLVRDPVVGPLVRARPGVRVPGAWDGFEAAVAALVSRHSAPGATNATIGRLVERHGVRVPGLQELGLTHTFPGPEVLAGADLTGLGLSAVKMTAIRTLAAATADGTLRLDPGGDLGRLVTAFEAVPGVGPSTAQYVALRLGEPDAFPVSRREFARIQVFIRPAGGAFGDQWRPWRALAFTHLWMSDGLGELVAERVRPDGASRRVNSFTPG
jgi:AraC family transcriptional regulator of adaptative response / DNA-3-methyladenine glycosylase II